MKWVVGKKLSSSKKEPLFLLFSLYTYKYGKNELGSNIIQLKIKKSFSLPNFRFKVTLYNKCLNNE